MGKERKIVQMLATIGVVVVGVYMTLSYDWPQPPAVSGLGFIFAGIALWMNHCPGMKMLFEKSK